VLDAGTSRTDVGKLKPVEVFPGVRKRTMPEEAGGTRALLVEIDAGSKFLELDEHEVGPEEVYVLEGIFNDGVRDYPAGTFIHNPEGSSHTPQSAPGCKLLVFLPKGYCRSNNSHQSSRCRIDSVMQV
jgi:anti-sigma factor ChrR (cupin superfamily)